MAGNTFGQLFRLTTAGESHGPGYVAILDGVPPGLELSEADIQPDLDRRRPGQSSIVTQRQEADTIEILSGVFEGHTTGTPIALLIKNNDQRPRDYEATKNIYRPGHADYTFDAKFGLRDYRGGGRSSARETSVRVAAGAIAKKMLRERFGIEIVGYVTQIGHLIAKIPNPETVKLEQVEASPTRCPDSSVAKQMVDLIKLLQKEADSVGGVAQIVAINVPAGWGEPVFDKLKADLGKAMLSLPAVLGFEYGAGFAVSEARGSENNDLFTTDGKRIVTRSNRHGGMLGGISSGMPIVVRCAVKPTSSLPQPQETVTNRGTPTTITTKGRHDPCLLPRFVPMAEAMMALVLADHALRHQTLRKHHHNGLPAFY
jgi:chorismate synthase